MHHALGKAHRRAEIVLRESEDRIPMLGLERDQSLRPLGAIAEKVGTGRVQDVVEDRALVALHAVDDAVGEPGERHRLRIDALALSAPFLGDRLALAPWSAGEGCLARRAHWLAVEQQR